MTPTIREVRIEAVAEILIRNKYRMARAQDGDWRAMWDNIAGEVLDHLDKVDEVIAAVLDIEAHGDPIARPRPAGT